MSKRLLRLYPRSWRERHEAEVRAMLDDTGAGLRDAPDLLRGAVDAHLHPGPMGLPQGRIRRWSTADHLGGLVAFVGGSILLLMQAGASMAESRYVGPGRLLFPAMMAVSFSVMAVAVMLLLVRHLDGWRPRIAGFLAVILMTVSVGIVDRHLARAVLERDPYVGFGRGPLDMFVIGCVLAVIAIWGHSAVSRRSLRFLAVASVLLLVSFEALRVTYWIFSPDWAIFQDTGSPLVKLLAGIFDVLRYSDRVEIMLFAIAWMAVGWSAMRYASPATPDAIHPAPAA